jgi:hypothetical protein
MLTFFGTAPCHRTHSFTKKPADKTGIKFYICLQIFFIIFLQIFLWEGVGDWNRLECMLYLKICKIILNYLENVRFWICSILENKIGEITREIPWMPIEPNPIMLISFKILRYNMICNKNYATWRFRFFSSLYKSDRQCNDNLLNFSSIKTFLFPIETYAGHQLGPPSQGRTVCKHPERCINEIHRF